MFEYETYKDILNTIPYLKIYNRKRLHFSLSYTIPEEFENKLNINNTVENEFHQLALSMKILVNK